MPALDACQQARCRQRRYIEATLSKGTLAMTRGLACCCAIRPAGDPTCAVPSVPSSCCRWPPAPTPADIHCNIESDYDLSINPQSVILTRDSGTPKWIVIRGDKLFVDDRWVALGNEDRQRIAAFDRGTREIMPLAAQIGRDAADIAFTALGEVAAGFSNDPAKTRAKLEQARGKIDAQPGAFDQRQPLRFRRPGQGHRRGRVGEVMPLVIGDIVGGAVRAAFSGDTARLERMDGLDKQIEASVEPRAKALEKRAQQLCAKMEDAGRLDNALAYRLPRRPAARPAAGQAATRTRTSVEIAALLLLSGGHRALRAPTEGDLWIRGAGGWRIARRWPQ